MFRAGVVPSAWVRRADRKGHQSAERVCRCIACASTLCCCSWFCSLLRCSLSILPVVCLFRSFDLHALTCASCAYVKAFLRHTLSNMGLLDTPIPTQPSITLISRKDYDGRSLSRKIANEDALASAIQSRLSRTFLSACFFLEYVNVFVCLFVRIVSS